MLIHPRGLEAKLLALATQLKVLCWLSPQKDPSEFTVVQPAIFDSGFMAEDY